MVPFSLAPLWHTRRKMGRALPASVAVACAVAALSVSTAGAVKLTPDTKVASRATVVRPVVLRPATASGDAVVEDPGCEANTLPENDDGSTGEVPLPFTVNFFGTEYSSLWVNNNGNVTFTGPLSTYTPFEITSTTPPIIAPFLADVDTRGEGSGLVTYGTTTFQGHPAFCVDWPYVGYFYEHTDKLNDFQMLLVERSDVAPGDFDIVFNYDQIQWETGDASGGSEGFGGTAPTVGFSNGDGDADDFYELPGSLQNGAFLDGNSSTGLATHSYGNSQPGRYIFHITGEPGSAPQGGLGLSRPWPDLGYGYSFSNAGLGAFLVTSGLSLHQVLTPTSLNNVFSDWSHAVGSSSAQSRAINVLGADSEEGVCFGLALSGGRFDSGLDQLADAAAGRSDTAWAAAGTGPSASENLSAPGALFNSFSYNQQFLSLIENDYVSQYSSNVDTSLQRQHFAYADPTSGFGDFESQLQSVMNEGTNLYDPSGKLSTGTGDGFAMIVLQVEEPSISGTHSYGHAVLAYSAEVENDGTLQIDVWDNNFPFTPYAIDLQPDGEWTYNAPYNGAYFNGGFSWHGAPGDNGRLAIFPLFKAAGLSFSPSAAGTGLGSGSLIDVAPGTTIEAATDSADDPVDIEPAASDSTVGDAGSIVDLPSDGGTLELGGSAPSVDVRGANIYMSADAPSVNAPVTLEENDEAGTIGSSDTATELGVDRGEQEVTSTGAGNLTLASDGSVSTSDDAANVNLQLHFEQNGTPMTATLYSGATTPGGALTFTPAQVAAAEAAVAVPESNPLSDSVAPTHQVAAYASTAGTLRIGAHAKVSSSGIAHISLDCSGAKGTACTGKLILTTKVKTTITAKGNGHKLLKRITRVNVVTLGSASYDLTAGTSETLNLKLSKPGVALLDTAPQRRLSVQASTRPTAKRAATQTVELIGSRSIKTKKIP
jgi:hypothetical protein